MSLRIQTNVEAFNAHRNLVGTQNNLAKAMERLSSGYRINRAADDAAGLAISEKLLAQTGGLAQAQRNAQDAVSLVQTAEGAMGEVHSMLLRLRDLAVQFNNGTLSASDKAAITAEVGQLCAEISRIGTQTQFNNISLLTGSATLTFQVTDNLGAPVRGVAVNFALTEVADESITPLQGSTDMSGNGSVTLTSGFAAGRSCSTMWRRSCVGPGTSMAAWISWRVPRYASGVNFLNESPSALRRASTMRDSVMFRVSRSTPLAVDSSSSVGTMARRSISPARA
jgi:flagellin